VRRALAAIQARAEDTSVRVHLLADIRTIFAARKLDRLTSLKLVEELIAIEGRPWAEWKAGKPLSQNGLARLLKPLKIRPGTKRIDGEQTAKGYYLADFDDAFSRYLGQEARFNPSHRHNVDNTGTSASFPSVTTEPSVTVGKCEKLNNGWHCDGVTDAEQGPARAAKGNGPGDHRCDHCGRSGASGLWDWPGRLDGIWLHPSCEASWYDSERRLDDDR